MTGPRLSLSERLLLHIRDGGWHAVGGLREPLERFIPLEHARQRFDRQGLPASTLPTDVVRQGCTLLIADVVADLRRCGLVAARNNSEGEEVRATPRRDQRFDLDPEFKNLLPRSPDEVVALEALILREGCRDHLIVWKGHRLLIDGYTRWRLLSLLGWHCEITELEFADRDAVMAWMWEQHCGRRNLSSEAKSYARGRSYNAARRSQGGDRKSKYHCGTLILRRVADELAKGYGIGRRTLYREAHFAEALDRVVANTTPKIRRIVLSQAVRVTRKQVLRLAGLPAEVQQRLVAEVITSRKPPRFVEPDPAEEVRLSLPLGQPHAQAKALAAKLGPDALHKLLREIKALLRSAKCGGSVAVDHRSTNGHAAGDVRGGRFWGSIGKIDQPAGAGRNGSGLAPFSRTPGP